VSNFGFALEGAWKVLAAGLILGAGLPVLFALGIRSLAWGAGGGVSAPRPAGKILAYALFAVVILGVLLGLTYIVASGFGKTISFDHFWPAIVDK